MPVPIHMVVSEQYRKRVCNASDLVLIAISSQLIAMPDTRASKSSREFIKNISGNKFLSEKQRDWVLNVILDNNPKFWDLVDKYV